MWDVWCMISLFFLIMFFLGMYGYWIDFMFLVVIVIFMWWIRVDLFEIEVIFGLKLYFKINIKVWLKYFFGIVDIIKNVFFWMVVVLRYVLINCLLFFLNFFLVVVKWVWWNKL